MRVNWSRFRRAAGALRAGRDRLRPPRTALVFVALAVLLVTGAVAAVAWWPSDHPNLRVTSAERARRAFTPDSWWNTSLPDQTPLAPASRKILDYLRTGPEGGGGCLRLAGVGDSGWGTPIYWATAGDPTFHVVTTKHRLPPELASLRIPRDARPAPNVDRELVVYDLAKGYVVSLAHAEHDPASDEWTASGATVSYLASNGLDSRTGQSDDPRNGGTHRGNNPAISVVSWDQVQQGNLGHVLKAAVGPPVADRFIFPMVGSDGDYIGSDPAVPPQGLRLRLRSSVDLEALDLPPQALVIARALQRYGFYIGDSGGSTALKMEDTRTEGRGELWSIRADVLCSLPFLPRYWDVVAEDYDPADPGRPSR